MSGTSAAGSDEREKMYETATVLTRELCVRYPLSKGRIVLRTSLDWERDLEAESVSEDGTCYTFQLEARRPFLYFKPCLRIGDENRWAVGSNELVLMTQTSSLDVYPYFSGSEKGTSSPLIELDSTILGRRHAVRAYVPPGYHENTLKKYPALYMQDGKNLFFPEEAFAGRGWSVDDALQLLDGMNAIDKVVVLGVYSVDRMAVHEAGLRGLRPIGRRGDRPVAGQRLRLIGDPRENAVMGSSLGGVVSFFMAWQWPKVFGAAASMSSTFSYRDDLIERVLADPKSRAKFYLDSGWPGDNFEATLAMALALS